MTEKPEGRIICTKDRQPLFKPVRPDPGSSGEPYPCVCNNPNPCPGNQNYLPPNTKERGLGVHCEAMPSPMTFHCLDNPSIIPDMSQPVVCNWPSGDCPVPPQLPVDRPDPMCQIPEHPARLVAEVLNPGESQFIQPAAVNHPLCPDAQLTVTIDPPRRKEKVIVIPECTQGVRPPQRPWRQCVENQLIDDQVRRPLARCCHRRELPPLVIPCHKLAEMECKINRKQRECAEREARCNERECLRLQSRRRHGVWNNTTESILERKRRLEKQKLDNELMEGRKLHDEIAAERDRNSKEWGDRAKKLMLYRKGLIRDFHAAMANSKMLKEMADENDPNKGCPTDKDPCKIPFRDKNCVNKMMAVNDRPVYEKPVVFRRPNLRRAEAIRNDVKRVPERAMELDAQRYEAEQLRITCPLPLPESYKKYIAEPKCEDDDVKKKQLQFRQEVFSEIHDKLATDAFIEAHENELARQACEYNEFKRKVDYMRRVKEKELIEEKVAHNIKMQEKAAEALSQVTQNKQRQTNGDYDQLRGQWESEWTAKEQEKKEAIERRRAVVYKAFWDHRCKELCKQQLLDPSREYMKDRLVADEHYHQDCERKSERRQKAEDIALYHLAQIEDKKCRALREKQMDDVWGRKMKCEYETEMCEMKAYAAECMNDWKAKGRPLKGMIHSLRKWDYDAGMFPFPNPMDMIDNKELVNRMKGINSPCFDTTAERLGFCCGSMKEPCAAKSKC